LIAHGFQGELYDEKITSQGYLTSRSRWL
jgi:hypothetical protein